MNDYHSDRLKGRCRFSKGSRTATSAALVQARKALTDHIFGQIAAGQTDQQRLVVSGLTYLKSLEKMAESGKP